MDFTIADARTGAASLTVPLPVNVARNPNTVAYDANGVAYSTVGRNVGGGVYQPIILTFACATAIATGRVFSVSLEYDTVWVLSPPDDGRLDKRAFRASSLEP